METPGQDMGVLDTLTPERLGRFDAELRDAPFVVADANLSPASLGYLGRSCAAHGTPLWFEPTSVPKVRRPADNFRWPCCGWPDAQAHATCGLSGPASSARANVCMHVCACVRCNRKATRILEPAAEAALGCVTWLSPNLDELVAMGDFGQSTLATHETTNIAAHSRQPLVDASDIPACTSLARSLPCPLCCTRRCWVTATATTWVRAPAAGCHQP
jgi:hypothetical protein